MKKFLGFITILLTLGSLSVVGQVSFTGVTINGTLADGNTVFGQYTCDSDTLSGASFSYAWASYNVGGGDSTNLNNDSYILDIGSGLVGRRIMFYVSVTNSSGDTTITASSSLSAQIVGNARPTATGVSIVELTNLDVGSVLLGSYTYNDAEGDIEGTSKYKWYEDSSPIGSFSSEVGSGLTYTIVAGDAGHYFKFEVIPIALAGNTSEGDAVLSTRSDKVNEAPYIIGSVTIVPTISAGGTLTANYTFSDPDGDADGSEFIWYKGGSIIGGATSSSYVTTAEDGGSNIYVIVTPKSVTGFPNTGSSKTSNTSTVTATGSPSVTGVCIDGNRSDGSELEGKYAGYNYPGSSSLLSNTNTIHKWFIGGVEVVDSTRKYFTLKPTDLDKEIVYQMTPVARNGAVGSPVNSAPMVIFDMPLTQFSSADDYAQLVTDPPYDSNNGIFWTNSDSAYINGSRYYFDSETNWPGPYDVTYRLDLEDAEGGCRQRAYESLVVSNSVVTWNAEQRYCWDEGIVTISVSGVPAGVFIEQFSIPTNPAALVSAPPLSHTAQVNISMLGAGNKKDFIEYVYFDPIFLFPIPSRFEFVIDSVGGNLSLTMIDSSFCENTEIKQITSNNLYPLSGSGSWSGGPSGIITNSDKYSAYIDPSLQIGGGNVDIFYTYTAGACSDQVSIPLTIFPKPLPNFSIADRCIQFDGDPTQFINLTPNPLDVSSWAWDFGLGEGLSSLQDPEHIYQAGGVKNITLTAETFSGCINDIVVADTLAKKPVSDFEWEDDCFYVNEDLLLFDNSDVTESVDTTYWIINGATRIDVDISDPDAAYQKTDPPGPGVITVDYYLKTFLPGCFDVESKNIYIRPVYSIKDMDYFEGFEGDSLGWVVDGDPQNTWAVEAPAFISFLPSDSLWYTGIPGGNLVDYSVESPCFDFREVKRPMIKLDIARAFDKGRDGAVLQYKEGNDPVWENIGGTDFGINWYKNSNISGRPGESVVGWSPEPEDDTLIQARQYLDDLIGKRDVKLRISYGSDGNAIGSKGFAFDNIWIGERSRNVLVEHFTNYNATQVVGPDNELNTIIEDISDDAMNIQYHTNYRADDQLYQDNPAVSSSRMLFYSLVSNPYTLFDGGSNLYYASKFNWSDVNQSPTLNDLKNLSLTDPAFMMRIDTLSSYRFNVVMEPMHDISTSNMTLYLAVTAKEITTLTGTNGQTEFRNVLRTMIPDAGGITLKKDWTFDEGITTMGPYNRNVSLIYDSDSIEVIAFLQNNITKEVYQAATSGSLAALTTSIGRVGFDEATFKIFPNPASTNLTFLFDREVYGSSELRFYNNTGVVVKAIKLQSGIKYQNIDDLALPNGIYIVKLTINSRPQGFKKLIIAN